LNCPEDDTAEFPDVSDEKLESDTDEEEDPTAFWTARATWGWIASSICWTRAELDSELCEENEESWTEENEESWTEEVEEELEDEEEDEDETDSSEVALFTCFCQIS